MTRMTLPALALALVSCGSNGTPSPIVVLDPTTEVVTSELIGHPDAPHEPGRNLLWCATLELAWRAAVERLGDPLILENDPALAECLNRGDFSLADLDDASFVAQAGLGRERILETIREELSAKFGDRGTQTLLPARVRDIDLLVYAYLRKSLPFAEPFLATDPIDFNGTPVDAFGLRHEAGATEHWLRIAKQVSVLDHLSDDDFLVELMTESPGDRLVLARVAPGPTLESTIDAVMARIVAAEPSVFRQIDRLVVPKIDFDLTQSFPELEGLRVLNEGSTEFSVAKVQQRIAFSLDERGAELESEAAMLIFGAAALTPRHFVFDGPFLLLLTREGADRPYLALWIETPDLLVPA